VLSLYYRLPYFLKCFIASIRGYILKNNRTLNREKYLEEIKDRDTWTKKQIKEYQEALIKEMLAYCIKYVPYYTYYHNEQSKNKNWDPLVLTNWPILEKDVIRKNPERFLSTEYKKSDLVNIATSGTSGKPMSFWFSKEALSYWYALYEYRTKIWNGVNDKDVWANMGGQLVCEIGRNKPPYWVYNYAMKQLYLSSYHIRPDTVQDYINVIKKHKVQYILGYVSSIFTLANESLKQGLDLPKLKVVITNAEPLLEGQREIISKAFHCHVIQTYSGCEFSFSGNENPNLDLFIWPEAGKMEVEVEKGRINEYGLGELVVTGLVNKAMPLIRYRVGDSVELVESDKDYLPFDRISQVIGRTDDLVITASGERVGRLDPVFKFDLMIKEAQIIQEDYTLFTVNVVPDAGFSSVDEKVIIERLTDRVGKNCEVKVVCVSEIPKGANGKFKAVVSKVNK
jgi:phenylacetate-CoA ligase